MFFFTFRAPLVALGAYVVGVLAVSAVSDVTHDLSAAYDLTRSGAEDRSIQPSNLFAHTDSDGTPKDFYADVEDMANIKLSRDLAASHPLHEPVFQSCTLAERKSLLRALGSSREYVATAIGYLQTRGPKPAYKRWFGAHNAARASTIEGVFTNLRSNDLSDFTFTCDCTDPDVQIWIDIDDHRRTLHFCTGFWDFPADGADDSQAIIILAAAIRLPQNGGLEPIADGRDASLVLARNNPADAIRNVDSCLEFVVTVANLTISPGEDSE